MYFLTVDWCNRGSRGIFCDRYGSCFAKDKEHTEAEIWQILDCFSMVLSPQSLPLTKEEIAAYNRWVPLGEFSNQYGIALPVAPEKKEIRKIRD